MRDYKERNKSKESKESKDPTPGAIDSFRKVRGLSKNS